MDALRRRWALLVTLTLLFATAGFVTSVLMSPVYKGTASLLVGDSEDGSVSNNEILALQSMAVTYADIARREPVLSSAAEDLGRGTEWQQLRKSAHIRVPNESPQVIEISVESGNRAWSARAAGAIARSLVAFVHETEGGNDFVSPQLRRLEQAINDDQKRVDDLRAQQEAADATTAGALAREIERTQEQIAAWQDNYASFKELASTSSQVAIRRLGPAEAEATPVSPDIRFNTVMAAGLGFLLALTLIYLLESRRKTQRPETPGAGALRFPIIMPPDLLHGTAPAPANGRASQRVGQAGRAPGLDEGNVQ